MTHTWQTLLEQQSQLNNADLNLETSRFIPLDHLSVLTVSGDEAASFLQNLLTNDVNALNNNQGQLSGFCNAKGRLFAIFILIRRDNAFQIIIEKSMSTLLLQRLSMYILRSKVTIKDDADNTVCLGLIPIEEYQDATTLSIKLNRTTPQYLVTSSHAQAEALCQHLTQQGWQLGSQTQWQQAEIAAGIPAVIPETKESFTPQQVNLDLIDGVSFSKGCYPGQEIVARLHYLGTPSRRLFAAKVHSNQTIVIGSPIVNADNITVGHCVSSNTIDNSTSLLLSLKLSGIEQDLFLSTGEIISELQQLHAKD